ncbi:MAG: adenosine-specific kinase [Candidatus Omnitrophica bacterium]|nr:adenosine-specific kinase [Candidatus Omnitrophota bacterium]
MGVEIKVVKFLNPQSFNVIIGQAHFIKTVEDIYEALITASVCIKFGLAFCEASQKALVRSSGNDAELEKLAVENALQIGAGHSFVTILKDAFPINVLNAIKNVPEVCRIFCATSNPLEIVIAESAQGRAILGVVDGVKPKGVETATDRQQRQEFLRHINYKF